MFFVDFDLISCHLPRVIKRVGDKQVAVFLAFVFQRYLYAETVNDLDKVMGVE